MIYFLLFAVLTYIYCIFTLPAIHEWLTLKATENFTWAPGKKIRNQTRRGSDVKKISWTDYVRPLAVVATFLIGPTLLWSFGNWSFLESSRNFQILSGILFGLLLYQLLKKFASPPQDGKPDRGHLDERGAHYKSETDRSLARWTQPSALITIGLIALPVIILVAPNGSLDLGFLRSVKTPFMEAQFAQNETNFKIYLESEPQSLFRLGPDGLGSALHSARNELIYQHLVGTPSAAADEAPTFLEHVLQPVALCIYEIDRLYRDSRTLAETLNVVGAGLSRAIVIAKIERPLARQALILALDDVKKRAINQLSALNLQQLNVDGSMRDHPCLWVINDAGMAKLGDVQADLGVEVADLLAEPSVVHAASMFFLWSGNPAAALRLVGDELAVAAREEYPGFAKVRGFATRWTSDRGAAPKQYLDHWRAAIFAYEHRMQVIEDYSDGLIERCGSISKQAIKANSRLLWPPQETTDTMASIEWPPRCEGDDGPCEAGLAHGYFLYQAFRLHLHVVYESARELLTGRQFEAREEVLDSGEFLAERLQDFFITPKRLGIGGCMVQQEVELPHFDGREGGSQEPTTRPVTTTAPNVDYALALDAVANLALARAVESERIDRDKVEWAISRFNEALRLGASSGLSTSLLQTIREHRAEARKALHLNTP